MKVTAVVPSYEPDEKLIQVVDGLLAEGFDDIVVVNDGSHEGHLQPFAEAAERPGVTVLRHEVNKGKGRAMKTAFAWCVENRPDIDGVVIVDGDNQHRPKDAMAVAEAMCREPDKLWLGVRDFSLTGLRAIARKHLPLMCSIGGERYEYETQMLLSLKGAGLGVGEVVIDTVYIDENQTSHFNTVKDSWRIYKLIFRHLFHGDKKE